MPEIIVGTEVEAFQLLEQVYRGEVQHPEDLDVKFQGWPIVTLALKGDKYRQSITPTVMRSFLDYQREWYRGYATAMYGTPEINLIPKTERDDLEFNVRVSNGSAIYSIDFTQILTNRLLKNQDNTRNLSPPEYFIS